MLWAEFQTSDTIELMLWLCVRFSMYSGKSGTNGFVITCSHSHGKHAFFFFSYDTLCFAASIPVDLRYSVVFIGFTFFVLDPRMRWCISLTFINIFSRWYVKYSIQYIIKTGIDFNLLFWLHKTEHAYQINTHN